MPRSLQVEELLAYLAGETTSEQSAQIRAALDVQPEARQTLETLFRLMQDLGTLREHAPAMEVSDSQIARLASLYQPPRPGVLALLASGVRDIVSTRVFDSLRAPERVLGFRGAPSRRLIRFEWDGGHADVRIAADASASERHWLTGEIGGSPASSVVLVDRSSGARQSFEPMADGAFEFCVEPGEYDATIVSEGALITLSLPSIGSRSS